MATDILPLRTTTHRGTTHPLPFKGRAGVGMGVNAGNRDPIPLPASPLKGEERSPL